MKNLHLTLEEFFKSIDFSILIEQKLILLNHISDIDDGPKTTKIIEALDGILHLIDRLQDHVVDDLKLYTDEEVFNLSKED